MSNSNGKTTRWIAPTPHDPLKLAREYLTGGELWSRVGLCAVTALILWAVTSAWAPSFPYRARQAPRYNVHARTAFDYPDPIETNLARERARRNEPVHYKNDQRMLGDVRESLINRVFELKDKPFEEIDVPLWKEFLSGQTSNEAAWDEEDVRESFERFRKALQKDTALEAFRKALELALMDFVKNGLIENLEHEPGEEGNALEIRVHPIGNPADTRLVDVSQVRIAEIADSLHAQLTSAFQQQPDLADGEFLADRVYDWLFPKLPKTLSIDEQATESAMRRAERNTPKKFKIYGPGDPLQKKSMDSTDVNVIAAGQPLDEDDIQLLRAEHNAYVANLSVAQRLTYTLADWGMYVAVFSLLCGYLYYRDRHLIDDLRHFSLLLGLFMITIVTAWVLSINEFWRAELIPISMFAMTIAIAYHRELALLMSALAAMVFSISHGYGIQEFVILTATCFVASMLCGQIRSRTKLVYIGLISALVAFPTTIGVGTMTGHPLELNYFFSSLFVDALWFAGNALLAGLFMTALLPFLENWFGIQTDISLLELSDANHPLLKQLVQRAPGTYNHSINVASISEAAAEAVGANGLLCRVAAYFHDIGKMRKPEYFIENQGPDDNKHDDLVPTMSTLVIIAHVKDGVEMARKNNLPLRIIDIIEQHHGTTLVEYFYNQATKQNETTENATDIEEADFRYPGPKPQTREAGVTMLADSVESACRALRDPTPSRLENVVRSITKKKLDDGQFDECSLTLEELHTIEESLIKSLNAMYHARVKYPDQQPA